MSCEGVLEDAVARAFEIGPLPVVLELLEAVEHRVEAEVHRAHVERGDLGLEDRAPGCSRSSTVMVGAPPVVMLMTQFERCLMTLQERLEGLGRLVGLAGLRVARMQMDDGRAGLRRADRRVGDLLGRHRQIAATWTACGSRPVTAQVMMTLRFVAMA